jgi:hypothetical protein
MERIRRSDGDVGYVDEEIYRGLMSRVKAAQPKEEGYQQKSTGWENRRGEGRCCDSFLEVRLGQF